MARRRRRRSGEIPTRYVGLLHTGTKQSADQQVKTLKDTLRMKEITLVEKYAKDSPSKLEDDAEELVKQVEVIVAAGGSQAAVVAKEVTEEQEPDQTKRKSVVFTTVQDPRQISLSTRRKPDGNGRANFRA